MIMTNQRHRKQHNERKIKFKHMKLRHRDHNQCLCKNYGLEFEPPRLFHNSLVNFEYILHVPLKRVTEHPILISHLVLEEFQGLSMGLDFPKKGFWVLFYLASLLLNRREPSILVTRATIMKGKPCIFATYFKELKALTSSSSITSFSWRLEHVMSIASTFPFRVSLS